MNAGDLLVGVSTFESDPRVTNLPRVGDYENVDWERIAALKPKHMIMQMAADRVPEGLRERVAKLGTELHVIQIDRIQDPMRRARTLGKAIGREEDGRALELRMVKQMAAITARVDGRPRVRTLIALSEDGLAVAGARTFLDDALRDAGGANVVGDRTGYLKLDREQILKLAPDVIIQLAPAATKSERDKNAAVWASLSTIPAVRDKRILVIDDPWALLPASHVGDLTERIADFLHPTSPTTQP